MRIILYPQQKRFYPIDHSENAKKGNRYVKKEHKSFRFIYAHFGTPLLLVLFMSVASLLFSSSNLNKLSVSLTCAAMAMPFVADRLSSLVDLCPDCYKYFNDNLIFGNIHLLRSSRLVLACPILRINLRVISTSCVRIRREWQI